MRRDLADAWRTRLERQRAAVIEAVAQAFAEEIRNYEWFTMQYIQHTVDQFVDRLDDAFDRWRNEYERLDDEREDLNRLLGTEGVDQTA